jgi:23S rRNA U2552 (ribose-2'-O)-methylase RlmE/FtsJ
MKKTVGKTIKKSNTDVKTDTTNTPSNTNTSINTSTPSNVSQSKNTKTNEKILTLYQTPVTNNDDNIMDYDVEPSFSQFPSMPLFKYGFYHYIHQTKDKMELFEKPEFKTKDLHKIINAFEDIVPQEDFIRQFKNDKVKSTDDINSFSIKYFNSDRIISRAFYKLWELLMMFPVIGDDAKNITTLHIAEAPGSFVQSVIYYRHKFFPKDQISGDKYIATSIEPQVKKQGEYVPIFNSDLNNFKQFQQWSYKNSDLTNSEIIRKFISDNANVKANFITADGGFNWKDENYQEQEAYVLLLSEIYCALKTQAKGGCFIIKFFETFTELTIKMIEILKIYYENVLITKPLLSRPSNSERYIVCLNFKPSAKLNEQTDKIYEIIEMANKHPDKYLIDIFPEYQIDPDLDLIIKLSATEMSNEQHKQINEMISYINEGNYFGEAYRNYLLKRREANDFWISVFYPISTKDLVGARKVINNIITKCLNSTKQTLDDLNNKLQIVKFKYENVHVNKSDLSDTQSESESDSDSEVKNKNTKSKNTKSKK